MSFLASLQSKKTKLKKTTTRVKTRVKRNGDFVPPKYTFREIQVVGGLAKCAVCKGSGVCEPTLKL